MAGRESLRTALIISIFVVAVSSFCQEHQFLCDETRCLPRRWLCDGDPDCTDGADELPENCPDTSASPKECREEEFKCDNGHCIPENWRCDGHDDCRDNSDEEASICSVCASGEFQCVSDGQCVSGEWRCNNVEDCDDGSDEDNCSSQASTVSTPPTPDKFTCNNRRQIPYRWACDGADDCLDGSDEKNCTNGSSSEAVTAVPLCMEGEFQCGLTCIMEKWKCDGKADCESGEDESNCPATCPANHFKCINAGCIPYHMRCDGTVHCMDASDEQECPTEPPRTQSPKMNITCDPSHYFLCRDEKCIPNRLVCDGNSDCSGGEDETTQLCGVDECQEKNGGCEHLCVNTKESYYCQCREGYRPVRKFNCEDIDECVEAPGSCSQKCTNTEGGFHCSCLPGYRRDPGNYTRCKADSGDPYLIFSHSYDIRILRLRDRELTTLVKDARRATALDYQYSSNQILWCDNKEKKIKRAYITNPEVAEVLVEGKTMEVDGLAVDWIHQNIYYTEVSASKVRMISWDGQWTRTIVTDKLDHPRAIAANPIDGYIYWTDWGSAPKIERSGLDGNDRTALVSDPHVHWPNSITIDYVNNKLYWCDGYLNQIKMSNMDGSGIETVLYSPVVLRLPFSLTVFEDRMYWVDWSETALFSADKFNGENIEHISAGHLLEAPRVVHVFHKYRQPAGENVCASHKCSHFCVRTSLGRPVCVCPDGFWLSTSDASTCLNGTVAIIPAGNIDSTGVEISNGNNTSSSSFEPQVANTQDKEEIGPQASMVFGVVLGSLVMLALAVGIFVGFMKIRRKVVIHTRFPNPVYRKTTGIEEDGSGYTIEQDGMMFLPQGYDYTEAQDKVLIDHDDGVLLTPKK